MPWRPNSVGDKRKSRYGHDWQKQRAATLRAEPLCRLCLSVGRTVAAVVVDHIKPLEDGGTNEQSNLQALCKRCHDSIKTPADVRLRRAADRTIVCVRCVSFDETISFGFDVRALRRTLAAEFGFAHAHAIAHAAAFGAVEGAARGDLPPVRLLILTDDAEQARLLAARHGCSLTVEGIGQIPRVGDRSAAEVEWLAKRYGVEYSSRHGQSLQGQQPSSA
jgi:5-methylcytosine-specific restriction protein A